MSNDLISRESLKKAINDNGYSHYFEIFDIIDNAPTVEVENIITAHENIGYEKGFHDGYAQCVTDNCSDHNFNYCPNCGAKMKGEAEHNGNI